MAVEETKEIHPLLYNASGNPKLQVVTTANVITELADETPCFVLPSAYAQIMRMVPRGEVITTSYISRYLAQAYGVGAAQAIVSTLFVSIAAWASDCSAGEQLPYWRTLKDNGELIGQFPGGATAQRAALEGEGHIVSCNAKTGRYRVENYARVLHRL